VRWVEGALTHWDLLMLVSKYFDIVFALDVIEHLVRPKAFLKEAYRVLRDEGVLIISTPLRTVMQRIYDAMLGIRDHISLFTLNELMAVLEDTGFEVINVAINSLVYNSSIIYHLMKGNTLVPFLVGAWIIGKVKR